VRGAAWARKGLSRLSAVVISSVSVVAPGTDGLQCGLQCGHLPVTTIQRRPILDGLINGYTQAA